MPKGIITKSEFKMGMECLKHLWLSKHNPELKKREEQNAIQQEGIEVGAPAANLFDKVTFIPDSYNQQVAVEKTKAAIARGDKVIGEATLAAEDLLCKVDYLEVYEDRVVINEVKSKTSIRNKGGQLKKEFLYDCAFQYYVGMKSGLNVCAVNCIHLNGEYKKKGELNYHALFEIEDLTEEVMEYVCSEECSIADDISYIREYLGQENIPGDAICSDCRECEMTELCWKDIPKPNVWDLNGRYTKNRGELYESGLISFVQLLDSGYVNKKGSMQIRAELYDEQFVDKDGLLQFLEKISFPLYFLDFETYKVAIPEYEGQWPYEQVPFQFSLHYMSKADGDLQHVEYLADEHTDPRRGIAEALVENIPADVCVAAYFKAFECGRLAELADMFPDLSEHLLAIKDNIVDFIEPFNDYHYLVRGMEGKTSIKKVGPALNPNDESLNYANLKGVKNGAEAMDMFLKLRDMGAEDRETARQGMLEYCKLDTLSMVKIYEALRKAVE